MQSESEVSQRVLMEASKIGMVLWRNNSGAFKDKEGRWVWFGLGNLSKAHSERIKSSDYIGLLPVTITPEMVGQTIGVFTAIEFKKPGHKTAEGRFKAQKAYIDFVKLRGGIAGFVEKVEDFYGLFAKK
jgi:hypothetical protein